MSMLKPTTRPGTSADVSPRSTRATRETKTGPAPRNGLFVIPSGRGGGGLQASIRGNLLELADPSSHGLAPTPDDLFIASIASELAWAARNFLRARGLADDVSVSAEWRTPDHPPRLTDISMTVTVPETVEPMSDALEDALVERVAARPVGEPLWFHVDCQG